MTNTKKIVEYKKRFKVELELDLDDNNYTTATLLLDNEVYETFSKCGGKTAYKRACQAKQEAIRLYKEEITNA